MPTNAEYLAAPLPLALDMRGFAQAIRCTMSTADRLFKSGELPVVWIGRKRHVRIKDVEAWLAKNAGTSVPVEHHPNLPRTDGAAIKAGYGAASKKPAPGSKKAREEARSTVKAKMQKVAVQPKKGARHGN